jgi:cyclic pyranopterin phosphate synthase
VFATNGQTITAANAFSCMQHARRGTYLRSGIAPSARLLRISVTDRCNFACRYCMPAKHAPRIPRNDLLSLEQLSEVVTWLSSHINIERVKITGGEPLVRRGLEKLIAHLSALPNVNEISLTTNGSLLTGKADALKTSGLARVNVSLDTLDPERFAQLTRGARLQDTLDGIDAAINAGLVPLKLNAVLTGSGWKQDVPMLLDFAASRNLEVRFIELMRTGTERVWCDAEFVSVDVVREWLQARAALTNIETPAGIPARSTQVCWGGTELNVGWIAPRSHPFCQSCERVRLDSQGRLRRCLMDTASLDLVPLLHASEQQAVERLHHYMAGKRAPNGMDTESPMSQIGG